MYANVARVQKYIHLIRFGACRLGDFYPNHIHSRDATGYPFYTDKPDVNTICGALVSGPAFSGAFTDTRSDYTQVEPAIDYAAGALCAFGAFASQPAGTFDSCTARSVFAGRGV
jgi:Glycosyl hydrolase family 9